MTSNRNYRRCPIWCLIFDSTHEGPCISEDDYDKEADLHLPRGCRCSTCQEDARLESLL